MLKGLAIKKSVFAQEQNRADVARRREQWQKYQGRIDAKRLVFIDETWTKINMTPLRGWGPCEARVKGRAPFGRWKTMTFIGALRHDRNQIVRQRSRLKNIIQSILHSHLIPLFRTPICAGP